MDKMDGEKYEFIVQYPLNSSTISAPLLLEQIYMAQENLLLKSGIVTMRLMLRGRLISPVGLLIELLLALQ